MDAAAVIAAYTAVASEKEASGAMHMLETETKRIQRVVLQASIDKDVRAARASSK